MSVRVDPFDYHPGGNYAPFLKSYGIDIEVEWLSDVLEREHFTTEFSLEFDRKGELAGFFNFVIRARD